jgi:hypothetical protein
MSLSDVRNFINQAQQYSMPTAFLTRLVNEYDFDFEAGSGDDHVSYVLWHHELVLYESTWKGLSRPEFADTVSVLTLYHEGTHAFIDLVDYDQSREFGEAMKYYEWAKLQKGDRVWPDVDTEHAVQEAAAMYVGNRASTVWKTWARLRLLEKLVKSVADGKMTVARGVDLVHTTGRSTVANDYWADMSAKVFGYVQRGDNQLEILDKPIFKKLADWCDRNILENKISDHLVNMPALGKYVDTVYRAAQQIPELAKAMMQP